MSLEEVDIFIQKCTSYNWPRPESWPIFYMCQHYIIWWNTSRLSILGHSLQNIFFSTHLNKTFRGWWNIGTSLILFQDQEWNVFLSSISSKNWHSHSCRYPTSHSTIHNKADSMWHQSVWLNEMSMDWANTKNRDGGMDRQPALKKFAEKVLKLKMVLAWQAVNLKYLYGETKRGYNYKTQLEMRNKNKM
jgi:hypothetical protein